VLHNLDGFSFFFFSSAAHLNVCLSDEQTRISLSADLMGMHVRVGSQWKQQRVENAMGPLRRAHPASGATWNVQVVRGKMSTQCLWHACRALMVGILLMIIGASMATIGYYSNDFALGELRSNSTVRVKTEQRGLHLNNLSYMGPIVMGVGGELTEHKHCWV